MSFKTASVKLAAVSLLIFANSILVAAQPDSIYKIPAGTQMSLKMDVELSSKVAGVNDTFTAAVAKPVMIRDTVVLPVGTVIEGRVTSVARAGSGGKNGNLEVVFESLRIVNTQRRTIEGELVNKIEAKPSSVTNALTIVGGTVIGAVFGLVSRSDKGVLIGAGAGAGVGGAIALLRKGRDVRIRDGEEFEIVLKKEVVLPVLDY